MLIQARRSRQKAAGISQQTFNSTLTPDPKNEDTIARAIKAELMDESITCTMPKVGFININHTSAYYASTIREDGWRDSICFVRKAFSSINCSSSIWRLVRDIQGRDGWYQPLLSAWNFGKNSSNFSLFFTRMSCTAFDFLGFATNTWMLVNNNMGIFDNSKIP